MISIFQQFFQFFQPNITKTGSCLGCGKCCTNLILVFKGKPIKELEIFEQAKKIKPYYAYFNFIYKDEADGLLYFSCQQLGEDKQCKVHQHRPSICRDYPQISMLAHHGRLLPGCGYQLKSVKTFEAMLKKELRHFIICLI